MALKAPGGASGTPPGAAEAFSSEPATGGPVRRGLGSSGVSVPRFVLGLAPLGGLYAPLTDEDARAALEAAWDHGVRAFDTAPHYGAGISESRLGSFIATRPRSEMIVFSKVGRLLVPTKSDVEGAHFFYGTPRLTRVIDFSRSGVKRSVAESCARLGVDRLDIAFVHDPDEHFAEAVGQSLPALAELRNAGVVGAIGVAMNHAGMLAQFVREADIDCVMVAGRWSLLDRSAGEELLPLCLEREVGVLVGGVFNSGILAMPGPGATFDYEPAPPELLTRARRMQDACAAHGVPLRAAALQFPLRHPAVSATVFGARSATEVIDDLTDLDREITAELWDELDAN
jgi:aryl-alcohol dehydrogenase-like predicted oxidoreductase